MDSSRSSSSDKAAAKDAVFIYSTPLALFTFDSSLKLLEKTKLAEPEKALQSLAKNEWLAEEQAAVKKASVQGKTVVVLGFKGKKLENAAASQDVKKLGLASEAAWAAGASEPAGQLRALVLGFTKKAVAASVSDDNLITQASSAISELNKTASLLAKRLREWYELYCPEASKSLPDHEEFVNQILSSSKQELLKKLKISEKESMGASLDKASVSQMLAFASLIKQVYDSRKQLANYQEQLMKKHCPNLAAVASPLTGAELIVQAGSLKRLAMLPSSTIQLLGAERELFRHLKDKKQRPPKAGVLHSHPLVTSAAKQEQGRIAKLLADKISIAVRVDYFKGEFIGDKLAAELKKKLELRET